MQLQTLLGFVRALPQLSTSGSQVPLIRGVRGLKIPKFCLFNPPNPLIKGECVRPDRKRGNYSLELRPSDIDSINIPPLRGYTNPYVGTH